MKLTERETHFEFGANWRDYAKTVDQASIESSMLGLKKLFPDGLSGKSFLDIGCGSGLHAVAALSLGAASVAAIDIDETSVSTTRELLSKYVPDADWSANIASVFDLPEEKPGAFDIVYSWGVLHHTGEMWRAIESAAKLVKPNGQLAIAIYAKTPFDRFWKIEKRIYSGSPKVAQWIIRQGYLAALFTAYTISGRNPLALASKANVRGMNFRNDAHDWLGGFPYETAGADELRDRICAIGFAEERSFLVAPKLMGAFGSGCSEFVFRRTAPSSI